MNLSARNAAAIEHYDDPRAYQIAICGLKHAFRSKAKARQFLEKNRRSHWDKSKPYKCESCGEWHLTTNQAQS